MNRLAKKTTENALTVVKQHIKDKTISQVYLFYGEEVFLKNMYLPKIKELGYDGSFADFNDIRINSDTSLGDIDALWDSYPMMSDKKFIYVKNSGAFSGSKKKSENGASFSEISAFWTEKLKDIPEYIFLIFDEKDVDARTASYKALTKVGTALKFDYWNDYEILSWVERGFAKAGKKIDKSVAQNFINICNKGLSDIKNEMDKLISFCDSEILQSDVDRLVTKSVDIQVFDITENIISGNIKKAINILADMRTQNMSATEIFFLIFNTFDRLLRTLLMRNEGANYEQIASKLYPKNVPSKMTFLIQKYEKCAKTLGEAFLTKQVIDGAEIVLNMRRGNIDEWTALETYITECAYTIKTNQK